MKSIILTLEKIENILPLLEGAIESQNLIQTKTAFGRLVEWSEHLKGLLEEQFVEKNFEKFDRHLHFINYYLERKNFQWVMDNFNDIKNGDFPTLKSKILDSLDKQKITSQVSTKKFSNKIFIVHGRAFKTIKELQAILKDIGLEPIVLHEQASGSRTIIEKLEKHSDVGFAFVLLTPDDAGYCQYERKVLSEDYAVRMLLTLKNLRTLVSKEHEITVAAIMKGFVNVLRGRARQNVVLEFGYFIGLLGRDCVCCLHQGNVELPSDMTGIVYIHFDKSLKEIKDKILQELKAAQYPLST